MPAMAICSPVVNPLPLRPGALPVVIVTVVPLSLAPVIAAAPTPGMASCWTLAPEVVTSFRYKGPCALYWLVPSPACKTTRLPGVNGPGVPL